METPEQIAGVSLFKPFPKASVIFQKRDNPTVLKIHDRQHRN